MKLYFDIEARSLIHLGTTLPEAQVTIQLDTISSAPLDLHGAGKRLPAVPIQVDLKAYCQTSTTRGALPCCQIDLTYLSVTNH